MRIDGLNHGNFPVKRVRNGQLAAEDIRLEWQMEEVVDYFDGKNISQATFFRHCKQRCVDVAMFSLLLNTQCLVGTSKEEIQEALNDCSMMLREERSSPDTTVMGENGLEVEEDEDSIGSESKNAYRAISHFKNPQF